MAWLGSVLRGGVQALSGAAPLSRKARPWGARPWNGAAGRPVDRAAVVRELSVARSARYAVAARDPAVQAMGREAAAALLAGDYGRALSTHAALRSLCTVTGLLPG
ncbi:hypothetical protein [Nonomuraea sp. NPDC001699]